MSSKDDRHQTAEQLLLYVDGELGEAQNARVRSHLEACWNCRTQLDDLQAVIKTIVHFRNDVLLPMVPPAPKPWDGLEPKFDQLDKRLGKRPMLERLRDLLRPVPLVHRYGALIATIILVLALLFWPPRQRIVSASELLVNAEAARSHDLRKVTSPVVHQKLRVRRKLSAPYREVVSDCETWSEPTNARFHLTGDAAVVFADLQHIYDANRMDWRIPLSASVFGQWRVALLQREDQVRQESDRVTLTTIATDKPEGNQIGRAQLVVRAADWHPVEEHLWVKGGEYDISELEYEVLPLARLDGSIFAESRSLPLRASVVSKPVQPESAPAPNTEETEMAVRCALHEVGADLGAPVEVNRSAPGKIVVQAFGVDPELQTELRRRLASIPGVLLDLKAPAALCENCPLGPAAPGEKPTVPGVTVISRSTALETQLAEFFGSTEAQQSFTQDALAASDAALSRVFALRALALRYDPEEESKLTPMTRNLLRGMIQEHAEALSDELPRLRGLFEPVLDALSPATPAGAAVATATKASPSGWQDATLSLFEAVQQLDRLTKALLTSTNTSVPTDELIPELSRTLSHEEQCLKQYRELLRTDRDRKDKGGTN